jgi:hypothetical protein
VDYGAAKAKGQRTKAFLRVLKYSNGGVLEVILIQSPSFMVFFLIVSSE